MLKNADAVKTSAYPEFLRLLELLEAKKDALTPDQRNYLVYLKGWRDAYSGKYDSALALLSSVSDKIGDPVVKFRARITSVNVLSIAKRHEAAYSQLDQLLQDLPEIRDTTAREQALVVAALVYEDIGQHDLSLRYANQLIDEHTSPVGECKGSQVKTMALYKISKPGDLLVELRKAIDICTKVGEVLYANGIRAYLSRLRSDQGDPQGAVDILKEHYDEVVAAKYPRLISQYDILLAQNYRQMGNSARAREFALHAIESGVKNQYTEPLVAAYQLLYVLAKEQGDSKAALAYHELYAAADKAYLDDVSAQQLAYQRVKQEVTATKLQIDSLNKRNQVLQLQRSLDAKTMENVRLYGALLITVLGFIAFWAYKTKRSQLHFMKLSRRDGLTGIFNRPHFIDQAEIALNTCQDQDEELCLIVFDLDHFKSINDKFGHAEGDAVLKSAVRACQAHLRSSDLLARIGGEEFGVLLRGCTIEDARERAEQLREAIFAIDAVDHLSASFGIAGTSTAGYELRKLMVNADLALYRAKHAGRNCVVVYDAHDEAKSSDFEYLSTLAIRAGRT